MDELTVQINIAGYVANVWMNRPTVHNALNEALVDELTSAFLSLGDDPEVRVIVLSGVGKSFCAGADVESMKRQGSAHFDENLQNARELAELFRTIASAPKPTIARVNGAAIGGGIGLVASCDIAIASDAAVFAASEVRLGLIPSTIAPYVVHAIGQRHARRLFQTAERITAIHAEKIGLIHESVPFDKLDEAVQSLIANLLKGAPLAQLAAKDLIDAVANQPLSSELIEDTARRIASIRSEPEAREGLSCFLEKRSPAWVRKP